MAVSWLFAKMGKYGQRSAIVWHDRSFTYEDILKEKKIWRDKLASLGIYEGEVVAMVGDYSPKAISLLLALIDSSAIIVPLTKVFEVHHSEFMNIAEVQHIFKFDDEDNWRIEKLNNQVTNPLTLQFKKLRHPGLVLFSSGSTGKHKAILHNITTLFEKFKTSRRQMRTLTFLLFDHIGGINTLFYTLSNGGTVVFAQSRGPEFVCKVIECYKVELLPTSPSFLNLLLISEAYKHYDLSTLKLITYGTEVMPESILKRMNKIFPNVKIQQTYGLSELGILHSRSKTSDSLWVKIGGDGFETKVKDGTLWIRAQSAMVGYLNAPQPFDNNGWLNTNDTVEINGEYMRILGRKTDIINVGGQKVYPAEVENLLMQIENIKNATVYAEKSPITGQIVAARINIYKPEDKNNLFKRLRIFCKNKLAPYKIPVKISIVDDEKPTERYKKVR